MRCPLSVRTRVLRHSAHTQCIKERSLTFSNQMFLKTQSAIVWMLIGQFLTVIMINGLSVRSCDSDDNIFPAIQTDK
ncbi:hypothetical protein C482_00190 [Natrialba chahannaoensis JCM 10990]|uniref:Uncharacterized protein n=1 Tax=Natrialba chahannaoensis JCM 10990 TaxID=1227492 RepID=M0B960_9EURY|nr:hypothetical protein C482_00190 [Natrialba chahannaoensis JCM 10990]